MRIAVAGGTGTVGRYVVAIARERGHNVVSLSRADGVDLITGRGLDQALEGADTVIDVSGVQVLSTKRAVDFFTNATQNLLAAEKKSGVTHHVVLSIVGIDKANSGLYAGKLVQEDEVRHGGVPWTILRSTQFHEFVPMSIKAASVGPLVFVPTMVTQPVAAKEVAAALVDAAEAGPKGRLPDLGGPRTEQLKDLVSAHLAKTGQKKRIILLRVPGPMGTAMRTGALIPAPGSAVGRQTFQEWLDAIGTA
ncbi:NAD-dependent epimerase/dehydratase family protein [Pseudarthrobacter sp. AG30]|uniref:SDR family oxidoreductase n=1 Tax=Pseudarthrobacter sp. AG30 TaxID=2249742 RepID=UPI000D6E03AF|nr:NAD(P)H-binding protein [Pseudarthrobacter sp. AG30]RAX15997.1 NAD-dependent epimerase/dehydratase family protein [Pseudarthrobacter sp. AG30]